MHGTQCATAVVTCNRAGQVLKAKFSGCRPKMAQVLPTGEFAAKFQLQYKVFVVTETLHYPSVRNVFA
jgi:hypothetical protein